VRFIYIVLVIAAALAFRVFVYRRRQQRRAATATPADAHAERVGDVPPGPTRRSTFGDGLGDVGLVALREIRERVRGRIFRVGTIVILLAVGAAIVIPAVHKNSATQAQKVGVVVPTTADVSSVHTLIHEIATSTGIKATVATEPSLRAAEAALRSGAIDIAVDADRVVVNAPLNSNNTSTDTAALAQSLAAGLGVEQSYRAAGLSGQQIEQLAHARAAPVQSLQPKSKSTVKTTSVIGLVLLFLMLTQYNTWIMIGVMQEKASRVVEVLLATVRPLQLLGGKVLGIGLVAMGQAALIVAFALVVAAAVGSDILHGTAPLVLVSELLWLVLGYAFYCWVYAAAGSMAERQDQVQTLALPLTLPILVAYVLAITTASTGSASTFFEVLAYLPPTAPFAMPVLVGLGLVSWWQFLISVVLSLIGTAAVALLAERIYRRAVLRSGQRVRLGDVIARTRRRRVAGAS
jgi:ABC-2 type transport system permease protein